jgi:myxalamid-type polyketide synthase MxaD
MAAGAAHEPIAIVGIGCRLPGGVDSPGSFWRLLHERVDAISEIPSDRFDVESYFDARPATPGKIMSRFGGFVDGIDQFDAEFFEMSPREAERLDPQHRLLLEVAWEALEDAGQTRELLAGSRTGVFVGQWISDYEARLFQDPAAVDFYMTLGTGRYSASGRLSYTFGLQGPSLTLDTACSSSLVAVHLACQSLWSGETNLALAGGANVILQPHITIAYSQSGMMSPDGHCKFGDARANGYVRSEGVGVVVLKPLSAALACGDPIYALIRGSAVNNDGRSSGFLATPGREGQEELLRTAYAAAGVAPDQVQYVEAHGTGTNAGDPVELGALGAVLGQGRPADRPCVVGSVKTNFGHTEGAAGITGLIKVALSLKHALMPATLHFEHPNPNIAWASLGLTIRSEATPWPALAEPRLAGVSSFGIAGTNAHVVLEAAPSTSEVTPPVTTAGPYVLPLSARSAPALRALAARYRDLLLGSAPLPPAVVCATAALRRTHHAHRLAVFGDTSAELATRLATFAAGDRAEHVDSPRGRARPRIAFVFPGQGGQWLGMGRQLVEREPVFRAALAACGAAIEPHVDWVLADVLASDDPALIERIDVIQPVLFAIQVALAALWRSWGVVPDAVVGHSLGEVAAAHVAGILSLAAAARLICLRSRLLRRISGLGAMAMVDRSEDDVRGALVGVEDRVAIAVSNSPRSSVLAGDRATLEQLATHFVAEGAFWRWVKVDVASHSPQVEPLLGELAAGLADLQPGSGRVPFYSTVTATQLTGEECDGAYWARNLRQSVRFGTATTRMAEDGVTLFVELSPHPVLGAAIAETLREIGRPGQALASLRRGEPELDTFLGNLTELYRLGGSIAWSRLDGLVTDPTALPRYAWQRQRYWLTSQPAQHPDTYSGGARDATLGRLLPAVGAMPGAMMWELDGQGLAAAGTYPIRGIAVLSPGALVALATEAARLARRSGSASVTDVVVHQVVPVSPESGQTLQTVVAPTRDGHDLRLLGRAAPDEAWTEYATARIENIQPASSQPPLLDIAAVQQRCPRQPDGVWRGDAEALLELNSESPDADQLDPNELGGGLQLMQLLVGEGRVLAGVGALQLLESEARAGWVHAQVDMDAAEPSGEVLVYDAAGELIAAARGVRWQLLDDDLARPITAVQARQCLYELAWTPAQRDLDAELSNRVPAATWLIVADRQGVAAAVARGLTEHGHRPLLVWPEELDTLEQRLSECLTGTADQPPLRGVLDMGSLDTAVPDERTPGAALLAQQVERSAAVLRVMHQLIRTPSGEAPRVWVITRGAQAVGATVPAPQQAAVWGLGRVIANEHPDLWGGLIDLDPSTTGAGALIEEISTRYGEDHVAFRDGQRFVARLVRGPRSPGRSSPASVCHPEATYLITGGLGGLGLLLADSLAASGARHLVLMSRGAPSTATEQVLETLRRSGVQVLVRRGDVADLDGLSGILAEVARSMPPLRGVYHAAGVLDDAVIARQDAASLRRVMSPKIAGAWNLHVATRGLALDQFVLYSSITSLLGTPGQANYAAANAYLDALAQMRRASGQPALSINWGPWADVGLATFAERTERLAKRGIRALQPSLGRAALGVLLRSDVAQVAVVEADWDAYVGQLPAGRSRFFEQLASAPSTAGQSAEQHLDRLRAATPGARLPLLQNLVREHLSAIMRLDPSRALDAGRGFFELGMDSLMAVELKNRLELAFGRRLLSTLAFDYPTVEQLAGYLLNELLPAQPTPTTEGIELSDADHSDLAAVIDTLSRDELAAMLAEELQLESERTAL